MNTPEEYANNMWNARIVIGPGSSAREKFNDTAPKIIMQIIQDVKDHCLKYALESCPNLKLDLGENWPDILRLWSEKSFHNDDGATPIAPGYLTNIADTLEWAFMRIDLLIKEQGHEDFIEKARDEGYELGKLEGYRKGLLDGETIGRRDIIDDITKLQNVGS